LKVILATCGTKHYCGLPKYFYFLAKHLVNNGVEIEFIVDTEQGIEHLAEVCQGIKTTLIKPTCQERFNAPATALWCWRVAQYLKGQEFDLLHCGHVTPYFYLMQKSRKPVVFQPFGNELFAFEEIYTGVQRLFYKAMQGVLRYCGQKADILLAEGDWQLAEMEKLYNRGDAKTLPVGIDIDFVKRLATERIITREQFGLDKDDFVLLTVNTFHHQKDYPNLIRALGHLIHNKGLDVKAIMVGVGPEEKKCEEVMGNWDVSSNVIRLRNVTERQLYGLNKLADCYVSPTLVTDFQMGIAEAEALGLPIIATSQDFMIKGNGFVVEMNNPQALASKISYMQTVPKDIRTIMGERSKEIARQWDFKQIAGKAIEIYESIL